MAVSDPVKRLIALKSGGVCAKPGCGQLLFEDARELDLAVITGQTAHIVADADGGPRADPEMPQAERDAEENLLLLCREHHAVADAQENTYTVDELKSWKAEHEAKVRELLQASTADLSFLELEIVA